MCLLCVCACTAQPSGAPDESPEQAGAGSQNNLDTIVFGVVPQQPASQIARAWIPLLDHLQARLGVRVRFETAPDTLAFERRLAQGAYDVAYMNPLQYVSVHDSVGYTAVARAANKRIHGLIVVARDSPLRAVSELDGRTLAFPSPTAFGASFLPLAYFKSRGMIVTPKYVASHDSVYRTVAEGLYPAGGGVPRTFDALDPAIRDKLRILWTTDDYTPHAIATHPRVSATVRGALVDALLAVGDSPETLSLLAPLALQGFVAAADRDWDDVRSLTGSDAQHVPRSAHLRDVKRRAHRTAL